MLMGFDRAVASSSEAERFEIRKSVFTNATLYVASGNVSQFHSGLQVHHGY